MKHPYDRKFFTNDRDDFISASDIHRFVLKCELSLSDTVFDVDGGAYFAQHIAANQAPRWLQNRHTDPMLYGLPIPFAENMAMVDDCFAKRTLLKCLVSHR